MINARVRAGGRGAFLPPRIGSQNTPYKLWLNYTLTQRNPYNFCICQFVVLKGPVKLIQRVKIAHSFLHVMSELFHPIVHVVLNLTVKEFFRDPLCFGELATFFIYSYFQLTMKIGLSIQLNYCPTLKNNLFFFK